MKNGLRNIAFAAALTVAVTAVPSLGAMTLLGVQDQDHHDQVQTHPDYSNNSFYKQGNKEGYQDFKNKTHKAHNHKYKNDDDRQAHEYGYQQGLQGQRGNPR
jgi:hypothetical protein